MSGLVYKSTIDDIAELKREIETLTKEHEVRLAQMNAELVALQRKAAAMEAGVSASDYEVATEILYVKWPAGDYRRRSGIGDAFDRAIGIIQNGGHWLLHQFVGLKQYDRWSSQDSDHPYGYGPRHGHIWFEIGMMASARRSRLGMHPETDEPLTPEEILACVRYLRAVQKNPEILD